MIKCQHRKWKQNKIQFRSNKEEKNSHNIPLLFFIHPRTNTIFKFFFFFWFHSIMVFPPPPPTPPSPITFIYSFVFTGEKKNNGIDFDLLIFFNVHFLFFGSFFFHFSIQNKTKRNDICFFLKIFQKKIHFFFPK